MNSQSFDRRGLLGRKSWLFAGSERGADRAAAMATLIMTVKFNDVDPLAWLADLLGRIAGIPQRRLHELLPGNGNARHQIPPPLRQPNYHAGSKRNRRAVRSSGVELKCRTRTGQDGSMMRVIAGWPPRLLSRRPQYRRG
jgi:hypothetical protein